MNPADYSPLFYETVWRLARQTDLLFILWSILFVTANTYLIYRITKMYLKWKELILAGSVLIISLVAGEIVLRQFDYKPGTHTYVRYFTPVDSLYFLEGFCTDSLGIMKVDLQSRQKVCENIRTKNALYSKTQIHEVFSLAGESEDLMEGRIANNFSEFYKTLVKKDSSALSAFEKAILDYVDCPINEDGFRSIAFKHYGEKRKTVLLLGDSFTWGHSTSKKSYSFADELLAKGYVVYNTGISATDVAQYLAVAKEYIPVLKPDVVVVNFFLGNDITYYKREVKPFTPVVFPTSAGNLIACPQGKYFDNAYEAYNIKLHQWQIPEQDNVMNYIMAKTVITTLTWRVLVKLGLTNYGSSDVGIYYNEAAKRKYKEPYCNSELKVIKAIAEVNGAKFILSSLPEVYTYTFNTKKDFPDLFEGLDYVEMEVSKIDYNLDDGHFNDFGHKRYADFLIQQLEAHE